MLSTKIIILAIIALLSIDTSHRPIIEMKECFLNLKEDMRAMPSYLADRIHDEKDDDEHIIIYFKEDKDISQE